MSDSIYDKIDGIYTTACDNAALAWTETEKQADEEFNLALTEARATRNKTKKLARELYEATVALAECKKLQEYDVANIILLEKERTQ